MLFLQINTSVKLQSQVGDTMNKDDIRISFAKYRITRFDIIIPCRSEPFSVNPAHIGNWTIEKEYEKFYFPYLEFRCLVPDTVYEDVMKEPENVYIDLKVEYALFEDIFEMDPAESLYSYGTIFDDRFYAFIDNKSPKVTDESPGEKEKAKIARDEDNLTQESFSNGRPLVMALYKADHIFKINKIINKVLSKCTTCDAIAYYLQELGFSNVLMSPADISKMYDQLALAPLPVVDSMLYTCNTYGLHKAGTVIFFDYDTIYILDKKLGCTAWVNNEYKTTYLASFPATSDNAILKSGFYSNGKEKYSLLNIVGDSLSVVNETMFADQSIGGNLVVIDTNTGDVSQLQTPLTVNENSTANTGEPNRVVVFDQGNTSMTSHDLTEMKQNQIILNMVVENANIRCMAPNKDFIFTTDNPKYTKYCGHYRITKMSAVFTKKSSLYEPLCTLTVVGGPS